MHFGTGCLGQALVWIPKPVVTFELYNASEGLHFHQQESNFILMEDKGLAFEKEGGRQGRTCAWKVSVGRGRTGDYIKFIVVYLCCLQRRSIRRCAGHVIKSRRRASNSSPRRSKDIDGRRLSRRVPSAIVCPAPAPRFGVEPPIVGRLDDFSHGRVSFWALASVGSLP